MVGDNVLVLPLDPQQPPHEPEEILDSRETQTRHTLYREYLVKWNDQPVENATWESSLPDAQVAFNRLPQRNEFAWTSLMFGYANAKKGEEALRTYCQMKVEGVRPSKYTLVAILKACSSLLDLKHGRQIHAEIVKRGYESDKIVGTSLLDMYTKSGSMVDSQDFSRLCLRGPRRFLRGRECYELVTSAEP
ncbi:hypothetical protein O6H91_14G052500 [Diphasiastrum complanatum]|uniref:Uncharacterized protein n=1 Tax=Diphasiastrum complanatum TaxID=34168 RepID=A0ACC2BPN5_DIPCM|nr:hypothetical protein O6H91_14G052500 [Diphasiastrum complanatum]